MSICLSLSLLTYFCQIFLYLLSNPKKRERVTIEINTKEYTGQYKCMAQLMNYS